MNAVDIDWEFVKKEPIRTQPTAGINFHRAAVAAWDILEHLGYQPAMISDSAIYLRRSEFVNLMEDLEGECSVRRDDNNRYSCVWLRYDQAYIKIIHREHLDEPREEWYPVNNWKPLR